MVRKLILTFLFSLLLLSAFGQDDINKMKVVMTDGTEIIYALNEEPVITFSADCMSVAVGSNVYNHPLNALQRYEIMAVNIAGVQSITADKVDIKRSGDILAIEKAKPGSEIAIYGVGGEKIYALKADADGRATLSIEQLGSGVYILNINGTATKISK